MEKNEQVDVYLVVNAKYHDTNFCKTRVVKVARGERKHQHTSSG